MLTFPQDLKIHLLRGTLLFFICLFGWINLNAQELPPVINYGPNEYAAGNQNWMIARSDNKYFYFANSTGLLEYNGENWNLYPVPNKTIVRSVKVIKDRIYTGAYMEAGYWERDNFGKLNYTSLVPKFQGNINDGEQFWQIVSLNGIVIFRSFAGIYFYNPENDTLRKMDNPYGNPISGIFRFNNLIYFQLVEEGLFQIKNGKSELVIPASELKERAVMHLFTKDGALGFVSGTAEFFKWNGKDLMQLYTGTSSQMKNPNVLAGVNLQGDGMILGTVGQGLYHINAEGKIVNTFNQENILLNNTVLDLFLDESGNIWAGLDYGISMIDLNSRFLSFQDKKGKIGSVYSSYEKDEDLYLGTNQGLYLRRQNETDFQLVEGTNGQVWDIQEVDGKLFCGHNHGTFLIENGKAIKLSDRLGTWLVKKYGVDSFVQGHYNGISFLKKENSELTEIPMLEDFPHSSKYIEIESDGSLWVSNEHKGVFHMKIDDSLNRITQLHNYEFIDESGITSSIFKFNDTLYYSSKENIYQYNEQTDKFTQNNKINKLVCGIDRVSGRMLVKGENRLWGFANNGIFYISNAQLTGDYQLNFIYVDQAFRNIAIGYENISQLNDSEYLLGIANGYLRFNNDQEIHENHEIQINEINISALDSVSQPVAMNHEGEFHYKTNNISFQFSTPVYEKFQDVFYSYRLLGLSSVWSEWDHASRANFKNLPFGDYTFEVKAKVGDKITDVVSYDFYIERPFYLSNLAIAIYIITFLIILILVHLLNKRHHKKLNEKNERDLKLKNLEAEQEIVKLRNERLEQDMASKNRELAVSTMSLIKKNEFLTSIKDRLKNKKNESPEIRSVIRTIDKDINEEDNWKFFKKAFSNADKDFFKKVKALHPDLTSNDLKLCAYLRLNLSSKEIAPLLNISVKSVEIKRYRLRKKMNLDREVNLTDYILQI